MALARRSPGAVRHPSAGARMARQGDPRGMSAIERFAAPGKAGRLAGVVGGRAGGGRLPVIFVHGINKSRDVWTEVLARTTTERYGVAFDLRGHGASDHSGPFGAEDYADDVVSVMDHLQIARAHVV